MSRIRKQIRRVCPLALLISLCGSFLMFSGCKDDTFDSKCTYIEITKESIAPYKSMYQIDRKSMGFPPLPSEGTVKVVISDRENWNYEYAPPNYDVMLHFYDIDPDPSSYKYMSRTVGFRKQNDVLHWIQEQVVFKGPKEYIYSEDYTTNENIFLMYKTEQVDVSGKTIIGYSGPDERLIRKEVIFKHRDDLCLKDVIPILREWGYVYEVDGFDSNGSNKEESQ